MIEIILQGYLQPPNTYTPFFMKGSSEKAAFETGQFIRFLEELDDRDDDLLYRYSAPAGAD